MLAIKLKAEEPCVLSIIVGNPTKIHTEKVYIKIKYSNCVNYRRVRTSIDYVGPNQIETAKVYLADEPRVISCKLVTGDYKYELNKMIKWP